MSFPTIGVVFVTHSAKHHLPRCLPPILQSELKPRVLVMNSSSHDGTVELAEKLGAETFVIPRSEFNHGLSREKARKKLGTDIVVMMTPDAYAAGPEMLQKLVAPLIKGKASIAYARQTPHDDADVFASFARGFNYPAESHVRSLKDLKKYGVYTFFNSNSCSAYLNRALDEVGGFPEVLIGEDTFVAAELLKRGHQIAYVAEAVVQHSHSYSLKQEFMRSFDTGLARKMNKTLIQEYGRDERRGGTYVIELFKHLWKEEPKLIPYAWMQSVSKYLGYRIGRFSVGAPRALKRLLSSQDFYWKK